MSSLTLALPRQSEALLRARDVLTHLVALEHPHLVGCAVSELTEDSVRLELGEAPGTALADLDAARLSPGQLVTLGAPVAQVLAEAAAVQVHHGGLDARSIVLDRSGRPMLRGLGLAELTGACVTTADDVHSLARLLAALLDPGAGAAGAAVSAVLAPALGGHPAGRPTPQALAQALLACCPAQALPGSGPPAGPDPPTPAPLTWSDRVTQARTWGRHQLRRLRELRRGVLLGGAATGGLLLVAVTVLLGGSGAERIRELAPAPALGPPSAAGPSPAPPLDWGVQLRRIAGARQAAFAAGDPALLGSADAAGSPAMVVDAARVVAWRAAGVRLRGQEPVVQLLGVVRAEAQRVVLLVRERVGPYEVVENHTGTTVDSRPGVPARRWRVTLQLSGPRWLTQEVAPVL